MKRYVILLLATLLTGRFAHGVGTSGAQVPVGTGISSSGGSSSGGSSSSYSSDPIPLSVGSFDTGAATALTISTPGTYLLIDTITLASATTAMITISADDVVLDLGGQTLDGGGLGTGIVISSTNNVTIKNGTIRDHIGIGISIPAAMVGLTIENITINDSVGDAIQFAGTSFNTSLKNIIIVGNGTATGKGIEVIGVAQNFYLDTFAIDSLSGTGMHAIEFTTASYGITISNGRITDIGTGATTDAINFGVTKASHNVLIDDVKIATVTGQGIDLSDSYNVLLRDITISNVAAGSGVEVGDLSYDIVFENFSISNVTTVAPLDGGIKFGTGAYGILLNNGSISNIQGGVSSSNGLSFTGTSYGIEIKDVAITNVSSGRGIDFNASEDINMNNVIVSSASRDGIVVGVAGSAALGFANKHGFNFNNITINNSGLTGITFNSRPKGINLEHIKINGAGSDGIKMTNRTHGMTMKDITIGNADGNGINATGIVKDILIRDFTISEPTTSGIDFAASCTGVTMINGTISSAGNKGINIIYDSHTALIDNVAITNSTSDAILTGSLSHNVAILNCNLGYPGANGINVGLSSHGIDIQDCNFTSCTTNGMNFGADCSRVFISDFNISAHITDGIVFGARAHNVTMQKGAISSRNNLGEGIDIGANSYLITMDNLSIEKGLAGILVAAGANNITILNSNLSNFLAAASNYGIKFSGGSSILVQDCKVANCNETTSGSDHAGVWFISCNDVTCINVESSGHTGDQAYGFFLSSVGGGFFDNCRALRNSGTSATTAEGAVGFYLSAATGCLFKDCIANANTGAVTSYGFRLTSASIGNNFETCNALRNNTTTNGTTSVAYGFYSTSGESNQWFNCSANGNAAIGTSGTSDSGKGAFGFALESEKQSSLKNCIARGNGRTTSHTGNATGIYLDASTQYCLIDGCQSSANCTTASSGTTAYGIYDASTDTDNIIINCTAYGNKDAASPVVTTNYYMDLPIGGTTKANWPVTTGTMDSIIEFANLPNLYNIDIE
ncbi:MAG: hypothetical protein ACJAZS_000054 [Alteromonas naphthalenivorans]|jgi:hypothetical protein